ncbi:MAG: hypothetical protein AMJ46_11935 [Latescibacteria bacterium DG_63]|nr:MAG: hypothetical protein AMJ46_11935 [Latescibacteria bacterium DG_63]
MSFERICPRLRFLAPRLPARALLCLAAVSVFAFLNLPALASEPELSYPPDPMDVVKTVQGNTHPTTQGTQQQERPAVAYDGKYCLTVWQDSRAGWPDVDIYGARFEAFSGSVLDSFGVSISSAASGQYSPAVTFDGRNYLVVWSDSRDPAGSDIFGARVDTSGTVLDHFGIPICSATGNQGYPEVAFDGTNYLIVWVDYRNTVDSDIYAARMDTLGTVLDAEGFPVSTAVHDQLDPVVAFDGTNYLVAWSDHRVDPSIDVYGARVTPSGTVLDTAGIAISTAVNDQAYPDIVFNGTNYYVVWEDNRIGVRDIYGARIDTSGTVRDSDGVAVSMATSTQRSPAVTFDGKNHFAVWEDYRSLAGYDVYGARVDTSATLLDVTGIPVSTAVFSQRYVDVTFDSANTDYVVVWQDRRTDVDSDIYAARVDTSGTVIDPDGVTDLVFASASARGSGGCVTLSWEMGVDAAPTSFVIERSEAPGGGFTPIDVTIFGDFDVASGGSGGSWELRGSWEGGSSWEPGGSCELGVSRERGVLYEPGVSCEPGRSCELGVSCEPGVSRETGRSFYCTDCSLVAGVTYWYRIVLVGPSGREVYGPIEVRLAPVPEAHRVHQSYPNPFNPFCTIRFEIPEPGRVALRVFDASGALLRTLLNDWREPGEYAEVWDGRGDDGRKLPSGVYFYQLEAGDFRATRKVVLLK